MTGIGAYFQITWGIWLRHCLNGRQEDYELLWPRVFSMPEIVRKDVRHGSANGGANGFAKSDTLKRS